VKTLTSNTNRTSSSIKTIFSKHGGNLGLPGSVARQFDEKGIVLTDGKNKKETIHGKEIESVLPINQDELETQVLELPVDDIDIDGTIAVISTEKMNFTEVLK
jgi:transcriptional/translational regulatory protein YebC/TACO1